MSVDLPDPFCPSSPWISPALTDKLISVSAFTPPKLLLRCRNSITGMAEPEPAGSLPTGPVNSPAPPIGSFDPPLAHSPNLLVSRFCCRIVEERAGFAGVDTADGCAVKDFG